MANVAFPSPQLQSPVAVPGKTGLRQDNVYGSALLTHGASGQTSAFTSGVGQAIGALGTATASSAVQPHQKTHSLATTNLTQAAVLGSNIGDATILAIGIQIEQTFSVPAATGFADTSYGGGQTVVAEILNKMSFVLNLINRPMSTGPIWAYPTAGAMFGALAGASTSGTAAGVLASIATNGPGVEKRLQIRLFIGRADNINAVFQVAGGDSLAFPNTNTSTGGNPTLIYCYMDCFVSTDLVG